MKLLLLVSVLLMTLTTQPALVEQPLRVASPITKKFSKKRKGHKQ